MKPRNGRSSPHPGPAGAGLRARYEQREGSVLLTGVQALVRLPIDQRRADLRRGLSTAGFISGYEGSPLGGYDIALAKEAELLGQHDIVHVPAVNEEIAATSVWGTQQLVDGRNGLGGVVGFWYGKTPGLDRAGDAIRHGSYAGSSPLGGVVAVVGDDPACKSSTLPSTSEHTLAALGLPVLAPGTVGDVLTLGLHAVAMSRMSGAWVGLKITTDVADGFGLAAVGQTVRDAEFEYVVEGRRWQPRQVPMLMPPHSAIAEEEVLQHRLRAARAYASHHRLDRVTAASPTARIGLIAGGKTTVDLRQALRDIGLDEQDLREQGVALASLGMLYPLDREFLRSFARGLDVVVVVEEKRPFLESAVREALYGTTESPLVVGTEDEHGHVLIGVQGELNADTIAARLGPWLVPRLPSEFVRERIQKRLAESRDVVRSGALPVFSTRTPFFCSGCPHNTSTVVPEGSLVGAGIGCHAMVEFTDDRRRATGITQMGGEGAQWIGQAPFSQTGHIFQNLGDGTFFHSGSMSVRACVAAGVDITFKLLYNSAVAMTGGQAPAGGKDVADTVRLLLAEGVRRVAVVTVEPKTLEAAPDWPQTVDVVGRERLEEVQKELRDTPGTTVLLYDQECAAELRRKRKRGLEPTPSTRVMINQLVCEGCGDCGRASNCLSVQPVETDYGRKTAIHQSSCNLDMSCLSGDCPAFVTVEVQDGAPVPVKLLEPPDVADPEPFQLDGDFGVVLVGIGGTGVVTVSQVLATAAATQGLPVRGLDQTGLSQKAGPVVSHVVFGSAAQESASRVSKAAAGALLVFDAVVAVQGDLLAKARPDHTVAIVSSSETPTGGMVGDPHARLPEQDSVRALIDAASSPARNVWIDAAGMAESLLGDAMSANFLLVGAAFQAGALPLSAAAIESAIALNGVAVERNVAAFRWGRAAVADGAAVSAGMGQTERRPSDAVYARAPKSAALRRACSQLDTSDDLRKFVTRRANELVAFQNASVALRYVSFVADVAAAERAVAPGRFALTEAVAKGLYKLTAYKDEYEVARLLLDGRFKDHLGSVLPEHTSLRYHLHPPALRAVGWRNKIKVGGPGVTLMLRVLRALRRVRGTPLDLFGYAEMRRIERRLLEEYRDMISEEITQLDATSYDRAVALAELAQEIRGYEGVKLASIAVYRQAIDEVRSTQPSHPDPSPSAHAS